MAAKNLSKRPSRLRGFVNQVGGWLSRNIVGEDRSPEYTARPWPANVAAAPPESAEGALEKLLRRAEKLDMLTDVAEAIEHSIEKPDEAAREIERLVISREEGGTLHLVADDLQHDPHQIAGDVASGIGGVVRGVLVGVLRKIATSEPDEQAGKRSPK
jgi:hypothetical protein